MALKITKVLLWTIFGIVGLCICILLLSAMGVLLWFLWGTIWNALAPLGLLWQIVIFIFSILIGVVMIFLLSTMPTTNEDYHNFKEGKPYNCGLGTINPIGKEE